VPLVQVFSIGIFVKHTRICSFFFIPCTLNQYFPLLSQLNTQTA
jgi:hypothetical protein